MERLRSLLRAYNNEYIEDNILAPWNKQYCKNSFPKYWEIVFSILKEKDKDSQVIEIGCGLGAVTSILCYLGFSKILSFEKDLVIAKRAEQRIKNLFVRENIIIFQEYPTHQMIKSDILILVNCAYDKNTKTKQDYLDNLRLYYDFADCPPCFILEVIDDSYTIADDEFPLHIRLNKEDINKTFPHSTIKSWDTYKYPENKKSKTLYLIEKI